MKYNTLGKTDLLVSKLGFGASGIGGMFGKTNETEAIKTIHQAFDRGINYFDTSPAYGRNDSKFGPLTSEITLGKGLTTIDRSKIVISTKAGKTASLPPEFNFKYQSIINSVEASLKRLQTDYIDMVFLHDIEYDKGKYFNLAMDEGLKALRKLKEDGKIRFYGVSGYPIELITSVIENHQVDAILAHNHHTLINNLLLKLIPKAKEKKISLINASPFASGLLTKKGPPDWYPVTETQLFTVKKAIDFCLKNGVPIEKIALQFSLENPEIATTLFSCTEEKTLNQNIDWIEEPIDVLLIKEVYSLLEPLRNMNFDFGDFNN
ncbi:Predicted oxidoreductase [Algibacter lectus]|uniref:aldo/keto reductase n=1 Tax=Algibacter lectus TaxID=221126 RepID=UPI0008ED25DE|nr:aldo/keto reductase [Algibacter lectus]SFB87255.1 Predicted oxidoreductase [Algibacter lectus]